MCVCAPGHQAGRPGKNSHLLLSVSHTLFPLQGTPPSAIFKAEKAAPGGSSKSWGSCTDHHWPSEGLWGGNRGKGVTTPGRGATLPGMPLGLKAQVQQPVCKVLQKFRLPYSSLPRSSLRFWFTVWVLDSGRSQIATWKWAWNQPRDLPSPSWHMFLLTSWKKKTWQEEKEAGLDFILQ